MWLSKLLSGKKTDTHRLSVDERRLAKYVNYDKSDNDIKICCTNKYLDIHIHTKTDTAETLLKYLTEMVVILSGDVDKMVPKSSAIIVSHPQPVSIARWLFSSDGFFPPSELIDTVARLAIEILETLKKVESLTSIVEKTAYELIEESIQIVTQLARICEGKYEKDRYTH